MPTAVEVHDLVNRWHPYAMAVAWSAARRFPWLESEILSTAGYALFRAATTWREGDGREFRPYLVVAVRRSLATCIREEYALARRVADNAIGDDGFELLDTIADDGAEVGSELEAADLAEHLLRQLPLRTRAMIEQLAAGDSPEVIGAALGVSRSRVSQLIEAARGKLKPMGEGVSRQRSVNRGHT